MGGRRRTGRSSYPTYDTASTKNTTAPLDLAHVKGQEAAKRALEVTVAGDHSILLVGPRSSSKTLLGRCIPSILPPTTREEAEGIAEVYRRARLDPPPGRPFRAPHFSTRPSALVGKGRKPGEVDLARGGVLFLDDLPAFGKRALRAIRPLLEENGAPRAGATTTTTGTAGTATADATARNTNTGTAEETPADATAGNSPSTNTDITATDPRTRFMLVAAMRSCPCGHLWDWRRECSCARWEIDRYWAAVEELVLDLIHLHAEVPTVSISELRSRYGEDSAPVAERIREARARQLGREGQETWNAHLRPWALPRFCEPDPSGRKLLDTAYERLGLTVRELGSTLQIARTIADLAGSEVVRAPHVAEAIQYRSLSRRPGRARPDEAEAT
jgi:magnesium chelatase family protein